MLCIMRTTISLSELLSNQVRRAAAAQNLSVSAFISKVLDDALKQRVPSEPPAFRLITTSGVRVRPGVDLDRPRSVDAEDDQTRFGLGR